MTSYRFSAVMVFYIQLT